ncbi:MAG: AbgT family transporter, partial [Peptostreptococcaceae bacterium]
MGKQKVKIENKENGLLNKILNGIEKVGNKLPDPVTIFMILCVFVLILSAVISNTDISVVHPSTQETIKAINLLDKAQLQAFLGNIVANFQGFAPLGLVLVTMLGAG